MNTIISFRAPHHLSKVSRSAFGNHPGGWWMIKNMMIHSIGAYAYRGIKTGKLSAMARVNGVSTRRDLTILLLKTVMNHSYRRLLPRRMD
jgi:hypothetical protein